MTAEGALKPGAAIEPPDHEHLADDPDGDEQMFCYRHPKTETWLRCGRCDRPICVKCSVQGPVGSRCRECGRLANDPLTSFTPRQLVLGTVVSLLAGAVAGLAAGYVGWFSIVVGYFAGRFLADTVTRTIGYKRGPVMLGILFSGILLGAVVGVVGQVALTYAQIPAEHQQALALYVQGLIPAALLCAGAACFGAYQRLG